MKRLPTRRRIQKARQMIVMMNTINKTYFGGAPRDLLYLPGAIRPVNAASVLQCGPPVTIPT
jgi:hypothetical protein